MNEKTKNIIVAVLSALIVILLLRNCTGEPTPPLRIERYTDTIVKTQIDTIEFEKTSYITKTKLIRDTVYVLNDSINIIQYSTSIEDSLLSGTIDTYIRQEDTTLSLVDQKLTYIPKFPKYIHRTDSIFIKDSTVVTIEKERLGLLIGADFVGGTDLSVVPKAGLQFKNGHIVEIGYDPFAKNLHAGFKIRLGK